MKRDWMMGFPAASRGEQDLDDWCEYDISLNRRRPLPLGIPTRVHAEWAGKHGSASPGWNKACALIDFEQGNHDWRQDGNEFVVITEAACKTGQAATATAEWNKAQAAIDAEKAEQTNPAVLTAGAGLTLRVNGEAQILGMGVPMGGAVLVASGASGWIIGSSSSASDMEQRISVLEARAEAKSAEADAKLAGMGLDPLGKPIAPMTDKAIDEPPATPKADAEGWIAVTPETLPTPGELVNFKTNDGRLHLQEADPTRDGWHVGYITHWRQAIDYRVID